MRAPFEKFIIYAEGHNTFKVHVSSPEQLREFVDKNKKLPDDGESQILLLRRAMFIEDAIREAIERSAASSTNEGAAPGGGK
jgi:hypothetical protein